MHRRLGTESPGTAIQTETNTGLYLIEAISMDDGCAGRGRARSMFGRVLSDGHQRATQTVGEPDVANASNLMKSSNGGLAAPIQ